MYVMGSAARQAENSTIVLPVTLPRIWCVSLSLPNNRMQTDFLRTVTHSGV